VSRDAIALAMTGASGVVYGLRLLECLLEAQKTVYLMLSPAAQIVLAEETDLKVPGAPAEQEKYFSARYRAREGQLKVFGPNAWFSPPASGSNAPQAVVVCPCTSGTLAAIAQGSADNLIERAADVAIKEGRRLILVPREMPLSAIHLENMLKLARLGAVILPPNPGYYHHPKRIEDLVDFVVARLLDHLGIEHQLVPRWAEGTERK
jgi:4-hydroxy-3-polyprenylbenzoate decarboxylase